MGRARGPKEASTYQGRPMVPPEYQRRFELIKAVLGGRTTISEAATELGIARVNMQTLVHRTEAAILTVLAPRPSGPTPASPAEKALAARVKELEAQTAKLTTQLQAADDMMMAAGEIIRGLRGLPPSSSRTSSARSKRAAKPASAGEDPERTITSALKRVLVTLRTKRDGSPRAAQALGIAGKTLRRWLARLVAGEPLRKRRGGRMQPGPPASEVRVKELVETLHGLVGAESLAHSVTGVSRRRAGMLKAEVMTAMERRRKEACSHVEVTEPGVIRGFDAMYLQSGFALIVADACAPFRTTTQHVPRYDAEHVAAVLADDFRNHGAPLVLRDDRARCHTAPAVMSVLEQHGVLLLQGPPYHARYYGQLERQNREHRAWCAWAEVSEVDQAYLDQMKTALNEAWLRPTLGWMSAASRWAERRSLEADRATLRGDVQRRAVRLRELAVAESLAERLAIEQALIAKGYLRVTPGRTMLCG